MIALRGATTIKNDTKEEIEKESIILFKEILNKNNLSKDKIISITFSCTNDITKEYPGKFIREYFNLKHSAIMHFNEMFVDKDTYLEKCIRVMVLYDDNIKQSEVKHIYLNNAKNLRKDLRN